LAAAGYERRRTVQPDPDATVEPAPPPDLLGLVMDGVEGSWATRVLGGVDRAAAEAGCDVVVMSARGPAGRDWVERLLARGSTGAVLALVDPTTAQRDRSAAEGMTLVVLDPGVEPAQQLPSVGTTNWSGGRCAVEHLLALGHERIGAIGGRAHQLNSRARLDGYRSALTAAGVRAAGLMGAPFGLDTGRRAGSGGGAAGTAGAADCDLRLLRPDGQRGVRGGGGEGAPDP
jgi:DNA-binding LacI/PurR family transcriptional regulator